MILIPVSDMVVDHHIIHRALSIWSMRCYSFLFLCEVSFQSDNLPLRNGNIPSSEVLEICVAPMSRLVSGKLPVWVYWSVEFNNSFLRRHRKECCTFFCSWVRIGVMFLLLRDVCRGVGLLQKKSCLIFSWRGNFYVHFDILFLIHWFPSIDVDFDVGVYFGVFEERRHSPPGNCSDVKSLDEVVMFVVSIVVVVVEHFLDIGTSWDFPSEELFHFLLHFLVLPFEGLLCQYSWILTLLPLAFKDVHSDVVYGIDYL